MSGSKWTTLLTDPDFADNARFGKQMEDSIYGATYVAFKENRFAEVYGNAEVSEKRFPLGDNRDRFIFITGLTRLNDGRPDECLAAMETVVRDYPQSQVAEMAGMIINGVKEEGVFAGRSLTFPTSGTGATWCWKGLTAWRTRPSRPSVTPSSCL